MKYLYSILDVKAKSFGPLMAIANDTVAVREFGAAIEMQNSPFKTYAEDFELVCLGEYHDDDGDLEIPPVVPTVLRTVVTAAAWLAARRGPSGGEQLSLMKEA